MKRRTSESNSQASSSRRAFKRSASMVLPGAEAQRFPYVVWTAQDQKLATAALRQLRTLPSRGSARL